VRTLRELSLFSGAGIGALAAQEAGIETVAFCESDEWCRHALAGLWPGVPVFPDVRALTGRDVAGIDIISGGFPCVDISCAGKGAGIHAERSGLWFEMLRLVREVRPRWVLAENVPALRTRGADIVIAGLEAEGYTVWPVVVGAWACGAPHRRNRVWIVGHSNERGAGIDQRGTLRNGERIGSCAAGGREDEQHGADGAGDVPHSPLLGCGPRRPESGRLSGPWRWPLGPGAEQHGWEYPRVVQSAKSRLEGQRTDAGEQTQPEPGDAGSGPTESPLGRPTDGLAGSLPPSARRAALRILGNAWVPQIPALIYRWIVMQEARCES